MLILNAINLLYYPFLYIKFYFFIWKKVFIFNWNKKKYLKMDWLRVLFFNYFLNIE